MSQLETRNLTCAYGDRLVLSELTLAARSGEVLALLGPNGSGKTTLLRSLARLLRPRAGTVLIEGRDVWTLRPHETARQVALAPQTERRDWPLTVEQAVQLGRAPHRGWILPYTSDDIRVVEQALENTGLVELRERPITELSGGEWRRMVLARALAQQAQILLLDEPTAGLDLKYQVEMLRLVRGLAKKKNLTVVITLHDLNYASVYGDRLALLHNHALVAIGSPAEILTESRITAAYNVPVTVTRHPVYGTPLVVPLVDNQ